MDNVTEPSLGISTDCCSLIPKLHPHPRKKGLLFTVWMCDFPNNRLPHNYDVKSLYYCYPSVQFSWLTMVFNFWVWLHTLLSPSAARYPCTCLQPELVAFILSVYEVKDTYVYVAHKLGLENLFSMKCYCFMDCNLARVENNPRQYNTNCLGCMSA